MLDLEKYQAEFRAAEIKAYGPLGIDETWWNGVASAIKNNTPICYEAVEFIPSELYEKLIHMGWVDHTESLAESGEIRPPRRRTGQSIDRLTSKKSKKSKRRK